MSEIGERVSPRVGLPFQLQWNSGRYSTVCYVTSDTLIQNNESVVATHRIFRHHFILVGMTVPSRNMILRWADFRTTGNSQKAPPGPVKTARTPENVARMREAIMRIRTSTCTLFTDEPGICKKNVTFGFKVQPL